VKVLPRACMSKIVEIFNMLDEGRKGYLSVEDLKRRLNVGYSEKEVEEHFRAIDGGRGRLEVGEFVRLFLPEDFVIDPREEEEY
jgi:Ca2+-binding EF-hand superfamily protein